MSTCRTRPRLRLSPLLRLLSFLQELGSDNLIHMKMVTATEAARNFAAVLDQAEHGETIIVTRGGRRVATISPAAASPGRIVKELLRRHRPDAAWAGELRALRRLTVEQERAWPDA